MKFMINPHKLLHYIAILLATNLSYANGPDPQTASDDDVEMVRGALNKFFPGNFQITTLNATEDGNGDKVLSGNISLFKSPNVQINCVTTPAKRLIKSFSATFPSGAKFDLGDIQRVCGSELRKVLPNSISGEAGMQIKDLQLLLGDDGRSIKNLTVNLSSPSWNFMDFGNLKMQGVALQLIYDPIAAQIISGTLTGEINMGAAKMPLQTKLPKTKESWELVFNYDGQAGALKVSDILTAIGGAELPKSMFSVLQGSLFLNNILLPQFSVKATPFKKELIIESVNTVDKISLFVNGKGQKAEGYMAYTPPQGSFKFNTISPVLAWLDAIQMPLSNPELVVGNQIMKLRENRYAAGIGLYSKINLPKDLSDLLKGREIELEGFMANLTTFKLRSTIDIDADLGNDVKLEKVSLGIKSKALIKKFFMDGRMSFKIDDKTRLGFKMEVNGDPTVGSVEAILDLESVNKEGNITEWQEPFGIPHFGIRNLGGTIGLNPATIIGSLGLRGDLRLGKIPAQGQEDKRLLGKMDLYLNVPKPYVSTIKGNLEKTTFIGIIEAFEPTANFPGPIRSALNSGIDKLELDIRPIEGSIKIGADGKMFNRTAHFDLLSSIEGKISASGWMDEISVDAGSLNILKISGANGQPRPNFNIELGTDPKIKINGAISILGRPASGDIEISKDGFSAKVTNSLAPGIDMMAELKGADPTSKEGMMVSVSITNNIKKELINALKNFAKSKSGGKERDIQKAVNKYNGVQSQEEALKDALGSMTSSIEDAFLSVFDEIKGAVAVAGMILVKGILDNMDLKSITFSGAASQLGGSVAFDIKMVLAGKTFDLKANIDIRTADAEAIAKAIASQIGDVIIEAFSDLEGELNKIVDKLEEFANDICPGCIQKMEETWNAGVEALEGFAKDLDEMWNGETYAAPATGGALPSIKPGIRQYSVTVNNIVVESADDGFADNTLELYGPISYHISGASAWSPNGTNGIFWSRNRGAGVSCGKGANISVNHSKYIYAASNQTVYIEVFARLWEDDGPAGIKTVADNKMYGNGSIITLSSLNGSQQNSIFCTDNDGTNIRVYYTVQAYPMVTTEEMRNAIRAGNKASLEGLLKRGGDLKAAGLNPLDEAIAANRLEMANYLMANGFPPNTTQLRNAVTAGNYNTELVKKLMLRGAAPDAAMLDIVIKKKDFSAASIMMDKGIKPNLSQLQWALTQKDYKMTGLIFDNGVKATTAELKGTVDRSDIRGARMVIANGVKPDIAMINQVVKNNNKDFFELLSATTLPDQSSLKTAVETANLDMFKRIIGKGVQVTDNTVLTTAIDKNNTEITKVAIENGANVNLGLQHAVGKKNKAFIVLFLDNSANGNGAANYAVTNKDAALTNDLMLKYGVSGDVILSEAVSAGNLEFAKMALDNGFANPDNQMQNAAEQNKMEFVNLFLDYGADPNLAMTGVIKNNKPTELKRLIQYGADVEKTEYMKKASVLKSLEMVTLLGDAGANPDPGMQPAIVNDDLKIITYLLSRGADPKGHISTPACNKCATEKGFVDMTLLMLKFGADPKGLLALPSEKGDIKIVQYLVQFGADPNEGIRPAVNGNQTATAKFLLENGAIPKDLVYTAADKQNLDIVKLLCQYGDDPQPGMQPACDKNQLEMVKVLVSYKADATPFSYILVAVDKDYIELINFLIGQGSDPNRANQKGLYLIHIAAGKKNRVATVKALVDGKADLEVKSAKGSTALHLAVRKGNKNLELVEFLVTAGADVNATNNKGKSVLQRTPGLAKKTRDFLKENGAVAKVGKDEPDNNDKDDDDDDEVTDEE